MTEYAKRSHRPPIPFIFLKIKRKSLQSFKKFVGPILPFGYRGYVEDFNFVFSSIKGQNIKLATRDYDIIRDITSSTNGVGKTRLKRNDFLQLKVIMKKPVWISVFCTGKIYRSQR